MFTEKIKKRFQNPKNVGNLINCNAKGRADGDDCSDHIVIKLNIENEIIKNAKFQVCGCPGAICTSDVFIDLIKGKKIKDALLVKEKEIAEVLGIFPKEYLHCAKLPITAFRTALEKDNTKIIGITGGKGGTGKSTVATALAFELAKKHKVLLVDADVDCPNDHLFLNVKRKLYKKVKQRIPKWNFEKCTKCGLCGQVCKTNAIVSIKNKKPIFVPTQCNGCGACEIKCPSNAIFWSEKEIGKIYIGNNYNIDLVSGDLKVNEVISEVVVNELNNIIKKKRNDYDYIIVDTAAGTHCPVIAALEICNQIFAVTEPTPLGRHDLDFILQLTQKMKINTKIILNRSDIGDKAIIESLVKKYQTKIVAEIPYSKDIALKHAKKEAVENENIKKIIKDSIL
jgi:MinD superfamily P-loop ATPase/NifU-like protein involved in Fe-S cluster formation